MKKSVISAGVATLALGLALGCTARADTSNADESSKPTQDRLSTASKNLDKAFSDQFVKGQIDRDALAPLASAVIEATPEALRPQTQAHIDAMIAHGVEQAAQLTAEQRAQIAAAHAQNQARIEWYGGFGYGYPYAGWGYGLGYAWPAYGYGAYGYGLGLGYAGCGWGACAGAWW